MEKKVIKLKSMVTIITLMLFAFNIFYTDKTVNAVTTAPVKTKSITSVGVSSSSIKVSWTTVSGASGYSVYRATSRTGTYTLLANTTKTTYTNTGLKSGNQYYYKIKTYKNIGATKIYSGYSDIASAIPTALSVPVGVKAEPATDTSIDIIWSAVKGASGYEVQIAFSDGDQFSTLDITGDTKITNTDLVPGITYYYKVRSYRGAGSSKEYSAFSKIVKANTHFVHVESVAVDKETDSIVIGQSDKITATVLPAEANEPNVIWSSSDEKIVAVDKNGIITSKSLGTAIITATSTDGNKTSSCIVTVGPIKVTQLTLDKASATLIIGNYTTITATAKPDNATYKEVTWSSSNSNIALVDSAGKVKGVGVGTATITATSADGSKTATCNITVKPINVTGIMLNKSKESIFVSSTSSLVATISPSNATDKSVKWTTSNIKIATVSTSGVITAVAVGTVTITAITTDGSKIASCAITVLPVKVSAVSLNKSIATITLKSSITLAASISPSNATDKSVKWTTSDSKVATVTSSGKVTAVSAGEAIIYVTTTDGSKIASCAVKVPESISLNKAFVYLGIGNSEILKATLNRNKNASTELVWTSSDNSVASVDSTGKITGIKVGKTTIKATTRDGKLSASSSLTILSFAAPGIDVSYYQDTIDWAKVKATGVQFAMLRSSYGSTGSDSKFEAYYKGAKAQGIPVGAYHYSYASSVEKATIEAKFFISKLKGKQFEYPVVVDIEDNTSQGSLDKTTLTTIALTYLSLLKQAGYYPVIYASKYWFSTKFNEAFFSGYDYWLAQYNSTYTYTGAGKLGMWQYSSTGTVSGIVGNVDMDISFIDYPKIIKNLGLNGYTIPATSPSSTPTPSATDSTSPIPTITN